VTRWREDHLASVIGVVLMAVSLAAGLWLLPVEPSPEDTREAIGLAVPGGGGRAPGFAVSTAMRFRGCGKPAEVTLVASGTAEFWRRRGETVREVEPVLVSVPAHGVRRARIGMSDNALDIAIPAGARARSSEFFRRPEIQVRDGMVVLSGEVLDWRRHLNALVVQFDADWLQPRGLGTCFLRRPVLTGSLSVLAAQRGAGRATRDATRLPRTAPAIVRSGGVSAVYDRSLETSFGTSIVLIRGGSLISESSLPGPDLSTEGQPTWVCRTRPSQTLTLAAASRRADPDILRADTTSGAAYSVDYLERSRDADCGGVAAIAESRAGFLRDLVLLLVGAVFSLGAALIADAGMAVWRRRHA
jgi:hypothetical protein